MNLAACIALLVSMLAVAIAVPAQDTHINSMFVSPGAFVDAGPVPVRRVVAKNERYDEMPDLVTKDTGSEAGPAGVRHQRLPTDGAFNTMRQNSADDSTMSRKPVKIAGETQNTKKNAAMKQNMVKKADLLATPTRSHGVVANQKVKKAQNMNQRASQGDDVKRLEAKRRFKERDLAEHKEARRALHKKALAEAQNTTLSSCEARTVFNVGLPRTGTTSVSKFMDKLGYHSHHIVPYTYDEVQACKNMTSDCSFYGELGAGSTTEFTAYEDHPTFGLACPLVGKFKDAKFIHVTRPFEAYSDSVHYMLCAYVRPDCAHASWAEYLVSQAMMYGNKDILVNFCSAADVRPGLCHDLGRSTKAKVEWEASGLKEQWRIVHSAHDEEVRGCVPNERRLDISLGAGDSGNEIHAFLGCKGESPAFPLHNSAQHPA